MGGSISSAGSSNARPPPPPGVTLPRCCCPYCLDGPSRGRVVSHLRRHYRAVVRARARGGLTPRARLAVLRAAAFRDSRDARARIRRGRRARGMMVPLSPNLAFWAAHRWRGTLPVEIDFLGLGLHATGTVPASPAAEEASDGGPAAAPGSSDGVSAPPPADDGEEPLAAEVHIADGVSSAGSNSAGSN